MSERKWHTGMSPADYHAMPGYGSSAIKCFAVQGPLEFYARYVARTKVTKDTDPMRLGRAFHKAMECPDDWRDYIVRVPTTILNCDYYDLVAEDIASRGKNTKAAIPKHGDAVNLRRDFDRAYVKCFQNSAAIKGCDYLNDDQIGLVERQILAIYDNPAIAEILDQTRQHEVAVTLPGNHIVGKALLDLLLSELFLDFKTSLACNPQEFWREFHRRGYPFQIAFYRFVSGITNHKIIYVHNADPVEAQLMNVPFSLIEREYEAVCRHFEWLDQHMATVDTSDVDSQGIPLEFHNEPWGAEIDPIEMFVNVNLTFEDAEQIDLDEMEASDVA